MGSDDAVVSTGASTLQREWLDGLKRSASIVVPVTGIATSETLLYFGFTNYALWSHVLTLLICTLAPLRRSEEINTYAAFALVPLFRLVNLGMPVFFELTVLWFPLIYGPLIPALYLLARRQDLVDPDVDRTRAAVLFVLLAIPLSVLLAEVEFRILEPEALIPVWNLTQLALITVVMVGFVGFVEELLFRGVLQRRLQSRLGRWSGLALTSVIFGLMHSGYSLPAEIAFATGIGVLLGLIYDWTDSIALVSVIHGVLNVFLFAVIPLRGSLLTGVLS